MYRITFTNTHVPARTDISVKKVWDDNNNSDGIRPDSVNVRLLADGKKVDSREVTREDSWAWNFIGGPVNSEDARENSLNNIKRIALL